VIGPCSDKAYCTPLFLEAVDVHDAAEIQRPVAGEDAAIHAYTRPELLREHVLEPPPAHRGEDRAWALWRLAVAELWLRRLAVR
jgi:hypothetical protein